VRPIPVPKCRLVVVRGRSPRREQVFVGDVIRVGKAPDNDVVLDEETVSRSHFELVRDKKGWLLRDLRSTNGTFLDGAEIQSAYVRAGSLIAAGAAQLRVQPFEERIEIEPFPGDALGAMIGRTPALREAFAVLARLAPTDMTILVEGAPGTGKELWARTLHALSRRKDGPFVAVDCRAAPAALEAELLGRALERAAGGTLYLEEAAELALELQPKLLRVLEARELRRGGRATRVDVRVVAGSARALAAEVDKSRFRADLARRLAAVTVALPALRDRPDDLVALAQRFAADAGQPALEAAELAALAGHDWPGNLDELRSVVARGRAAASGFDPDLPFRAHKARASEDFERRYLGWLLVRAGGNISRAAREADMDRKYLHKLLKKHGMAGT
jgi:DNA-binding NtrC family response regulator